MSNIVWPIILAVITPFILIVICFYFLVYFQHPDDHNVAYLPKAVVLSGLFLCMLTVLTLPFDASNHESTLACGTVGMFCNGLSPPAFQWIWQIELLLITLLIAFIIPWTIFFSESFDYKNNTTAKAFFAASYSLIGVTVFSLVVFLVCYFLLRETKPPINEYEPQNLFSCKSFDCFNLPVVFGPNAAVNIPSRSGSNLIKRFESIRFDTSFLVFLPGFVSFFGWFLFSLYAGIGFIFLPVDLVLAFKNRPKYIPLESYQNLKKEIQRQTKELIATGNRLREKQSTKFRKPSGNLLTKFGPKTFRHRQQQRLLFNEYKNSVMELEENYNDLKLCHDNWSAYNPIISWFKLIGGIFSCILSLLWIFQVVLFGLARSPYGPNGTPVAYFLDYFFSVTSLNTEFSVFGMIIVGIFIFYLIAAVAKGNYSFGLRFLIVELHPMKFGGTYMNSFLVNTGLLLICVPAIISFSSASLQNYLASTSVGAIFNEQITYLLFFGLFIQYNVFIIMLLSFSIITVLYLAFLRNTKYEGSAKSIERRMAALYEKAQLNAEECKGENSKDLMASSNPSIAST